MKSIEQIIEAKGGWQHLEANPIKLEVEGFMPLCLEFIGVGPRGGKLVSVMHYYIQHGDAVRDPDLVFEYLPGTGEWCPVSYQQDSMGIYEEAVIPQEDGSVIVDERLVRDLEQFMALWDRNIREQGFLEAARKPT
jgi:hypothetical protein